MRRGLFSAVLWLLAMTAQVPAQVLTFEELDGWYDDDHAAALRTFAATCDLLTDPDWVPLCRIAQDTADRPEAARAYFEMFFTPALLGTPPALFTGYYEPVLDGSPTRTQRFRWPIYRRPPELRDGTVFHSRAAIEDGALSGRGLELAWLDDPVEVFFLHIQGSGRIRMPDGRVMRVGYGGRNGHAYRSVGEAMIARGILTAANASAQAIKAYVRRNPGNGAALLDLNPSYIFFRKLDDLDEGKGPIGAMGRSITALRSVAVDPAFVPLGAPVWVEKAGDTPLNRLMVAQDTGGAIKGAQRADIFFGSGEQAGLAAGRIRDGGRMIVLLPIDRAYAMLTPG